VKVLKGKDVVGHIPKHVAKCATICFWPEEKSVLHAVTGHRQNKRNNGLEVPCLYRIKGPRSRAIEAGGVIKEYLERINKKQ
jgi:hypothetical protein